MIDCFKRIQMTHDLDNFVIKYLELNGLIPNWIKPNWCIGWQECGLRTVPEKMMSAFIDLCLMKEHRNNFG